MFAVTFLWYLSFGGSKRKYEVNSSRTQQCIAKRISSQYPTPPYSVYFMKTFAKIIATCAVMSMALTPMVTKAVSYYPGYSCYYRDISGSCLNYQTSNPYFFNTGTFSPYGNRPSLNSFTASTVNQSPWDNRYSNSYNYGNYRYEEDDDDNYYLDDDDDGYRYWNRNAEPQRGWKYYYDEDDDNVRPYFLENDDDYYYNHYYDNDDGYNHYYNNNNGYYEYEHTRVYIDRY